MQIQGNTGWAREIIPKSLSGVILAKLVVSGECREA